MTRCSSPLLEVHAVDFSYATMQVLFGVSFHVDEGEAVALVGTNGAGKSTLMRLVAGLEHPHRGEIRFDGQDVAGTKPHLMTAKGIALVPGGRGVFPDMSVQENLDLAGYLLRRKEAVRDERISRLFDLFPVLADKRRQTAGTLSGGEQQQLALARVLLLQPKLLLVDELTLGLAPVVIEGLVHLIGQIRSDGTTLIVVEQSLNVAARMCERAVFLEKRAVRFAGKTTQLLDRPDLVRAIFFGEQPAVNGQRRQRRKARA